MLDNDAIESRKPRTAKWRWLQVAVVLLLLVVIALGFGLSSLTKPHDITETFQIPRTNVALVVTHPDEWKLKEHFIAHSKTNWHTWILSRHSSIFYFEDFANRIFPSRHASFEDLTVLINVNDYTNSEFQPKREEALANWKATQEQRVHEPTPGIDFKYGQLNYPYGDAGFTVEKGKYPPTNLPYQTVFKTYSYFWHNQLKTISPQLDILAVMHIESTKKFESIADKLATQIYLKPHDENAQPK